MAELIANVKTHVNPTQNTNFLTIGVWRRSAPKIMYTQDTRNGWEFVLKWRDINQALFEVTCNSMSLR
jgi:hypothetical protein